MRSVITGLKKIAQSVSYLPHFVSWVVVSGIIIEFLSPSRGPINILLQNLGMEPIFSLPEPKYFRGYWFFLIYGNPLAGDRSLYLAAVTSVDPTLYEAAEMDGAGRIKKIIHVTIPALAPGLLPVMFIMESGKILNDSFEQVYNFLTPSTYAVGDVISTFVYRMGIQKMQVQFYNSSGSV